MERGMNLGKKFPKSRDGWESHPQMVVFTCDECVVKFYGLNGADEAPPKGICPVCGAEERD